MDVTITVKMTPQELRVVETALEETRGIYVEVGEDAGERPEARREAKRLALTMGTLLERLR